MIKAFFKEVKHYVLILTKGEDKKSMEKYICIHGHFYQPPRENPWLEEVELQDSAYPYHDWNDRITAECYAPNTVSRILNEEQKIIDMVNNYSKISFNFGPTLLSWLEKHKPNVYKAILDADKLSIERFSGHGSALAQVYNHIIMPLANLNDKHTQVIWGIRDFQKRFLRMPEGMWLAETAVDTETLEALAQHGIKFTILAPNQAHMVRKLDRSQQNTDYQYGQDNQQDNDGWEDVSNSRIDPTTPYLCNLPSGAQISLFFYDGPISQNIAFEGLLKSGETFAQRLLCVFNDTRHWPQIVHIATDGETYGHHHYQGDMALAYCIYLIESGQLADFPVKLTNYGEYLSNHPSKYEVKIHEKSSWSCIHGVGRWMENCGCHTGMHQGWHQHWRAPLRHAMDRLRDRASEIYEQEGAKYLNDPWLARNNYIDYMLDMSFDKQQEFIYKHSKKELSWNEKIKVNLLLEMQKNAILMYTSCGWFFDEVSGIENVQIMNYASKVMYYANELTGADLESEYIEKLKDAPSNLFENGANVYDMFVKPAKVDFLRVGAHYAISSMFEDYQSHTKLFCYDIFRKDYVKKEKDNDTLVVGKITIISNITRQEKFLVFAVFYRGDHKINGGVKEYTTEDDYKWMSGEFSFAYDKKDTILILELMKRYFGKHHYSLYHIFQEERRKIIKEIMRAKYEELDEQYRQIYQNNYTLMSFLKETNLPIPKALLIATEYIIGKDIIDTLEEKALDVEKLEKLVKEAIRWQINLDKAKISFISSSWINYLMDSLKVQTDFIDLYDKIAKVIELLNSISAAPDLWHGQNIFFQILKNTQPTMNERASNGDEKAIKWLHAFNRLGNSLEVRVT
ncbi:glycoside hydrolase family protein [Candidatus Magnetoovum chiemensis]|nr:glycoside hydrolase family protein [Candidatus Magnetoovum chiemensis]